VQFRVIAARVRQVLGFENDDDDDDEDGRVVFKPLGQKGEVCSGKGVGMRKGIRRSPLLPTTRRSSKTA
jgi:hypothetical protein